MNSRLGIAVILGGVVSAGPLAAQSAPLPLILSLPVSVRAAGLGGASVGLSGDASATFLNPAGLATIRNIALEAAAARYPDGTVEGMAAGALRLFQFDIGGGVQYIKFDDTTGVRDNLQWTASGVYRYGLIALGGSLKYVSLVDSLNQTRRSATTDLGLGIHVFDIMTLAFAVQNIGSWRVNGGPMQLPVTKRAGLTFNFADPQLTYRLLGTMEVVWTQRATHRTLVGLEGGAVLGKVGLVARVGYGTPPQGSGQKRVSLGGGIILSRVSIDYAWQGRTLLGREVHRVGLRFTL